MNIYAKIDPKGGGLYVVSGFIQVQKTITKPLYVDMLGVTPQPEIGDYYTVADGFSKTIPASVTATSRYLPAQAFWLGRVTAAERAKVWAVAVNVIPPGVTISITNQFRIAAFRDISLTGNDIPLDHAETIAVVNGMEAAGIIGVGRAVEILA